MKFVHMDALTRQTDGQTDTHTTGKHDSTHSYSNHQQIFEWQFLVQLKTDHAR